MTEREGGREGGRERERERGGGEGGGEGEEGRAPLVRCEGDREVKERVERGKEETEKREKAYTGGSESAVLN